MRRVEIPGGLAQIKDRSELRGRDSKLIKAAALAASGVLAKVPDEMRPQPGEDEKVAAARLQKFLAEHPPQMTRQEATLMLELKEAVMVAYLGSWSLDIPLPTVDNIGDLPDDLYEALDNATGGEVINATVSANFDVNPDKDSPTGPSSSSSSSLRAEASPEPESTPRSPNGSEVSPGERSSDFEKTTTTAP